MTNKQYLIEIVTINVHTISESTPSALCAVKWPPVACTTVCNVYNGLVPRSPKTTPSAPNIAHRPGGAAWVDSSPGEWVAIKPLFFVDLHNDGSRKCSQ